MFIDETTPHLGTVTINAWRTCYADLPLPIAAGPFQRRTEEQIATAISQRHSEATGAPPFFVQVIVDETRADRYLGGKLTGEHVWIRGDIRAGRAEGARTQMMLKIMQDVTRITGIT